MMGKVKGNRYDQEFNQLNHQFKVCSQSIPGFAGLDAFIQKYNLEHCQSAKLRLKEGKSSYKGEETDFNVLQRVSDITSKFITATDALTLNTDSIDDIAPLIRDVFSSLSTFPNLPAGFQGARTVQKWVDIVNSRSASDTLSESEVRQCRFDLETAMT